MGSGNDRLQSGTRYLLPGAERSVAKQPIVRGTQQMTPDPKQIADDAVDRKEALRLGGGFEPSHLAFPLACRLVGDFGSVVLVAGGAVRDLWHHDSMGGRLAAQLIGDEASWSRTLPA